MNYDEQMEVYNALAALDGETVINIITDYLGMQVIDEDFKQFVIDSGYMDDDSADLD